MHTVLRTNQTAGFFNRALLEKKIITNNLLKGEGREGREVVLSGECLLDGMHQFKSLWQ